MSKPKVTIYKGLKPNLSAQDKSEGALYYTTDTHQVYYDSDANSRILMGSGYIDKLEQDETLIFACGDHNSF